MTERERQLRVLALAAIELGFRPRWYVTAGGRPPEGEQALAADAQEAHVWFRSVRRTSTWSARDVEAWCSLCDQLVRECVGRELSAAFASVASPRTHVYEWLPSSTPATDNKHDLHIWLRAVAPTVARELRAVVERWGATNGSLQLVCLRDHEAKLCGNDLSPESITFLRDRVADVFGLWVRW